MCSMTCKVLPSQGWCSGLVEFVMSVLAFAFLQNQMPTTQLRFCNAAKENVEDSHNKIFHKVYWSLWVCHDGYFCVST